MRMASFSYPVIQLSRSTARLYLDGDIWCATPPGFSNPVKNKAGFGNTQAAAVMAYNEQNSVYAVRRVDEFVVGGYCKRCTEWVPEDDVMEGCRDPHCPCN